MVKKAKDTKSLLKWKKKKWYKIIAPKSFREVVLGESLVIDPTVLVGRTISANLMNITGNVRKQNINVKFEIASIETDKAITVPLSYDTVSSSIKRLVRRKRDKIDLSPVYKSSDDVKFRIKPFIITRSNCANSIHTQMRKLVLLEMYNYAIKTPFEQIMLDTLAGKVQNELKNKIKKIYPIRNFDIRAMTVEKSAKVKLTKIDTSFRLVTQRQKIEEERAEDSEEDPVRNIEKKAKKAAEKKAAEDLTEEGVADTIEEEEESKSEE
jgi:small subunit ribosomal protein S3Ae